MAPTSKLKILTLVVAVAPNCFARDETPPIAIDCTFTHFDPIKLRLRGYSNTKVAPGKIAVWRYSRPEFNPNITVALNYVIIGMGFGHVTVQTGRAELGDKLRTVASDHGANVIAYEISGAEFRVKFVRVTDDIFNGPIHVQKDVKP